MGETWQARCTILRCVGRLEAGHVATNWPAGQEGHEELSGVGKYRHERQQLQGGRWASLTTSVMVKA